MSDSTTKTYAMEIENVFYLKKNENLSQSEVNEKICLIVDKIRSEESEKSFNVGINACSKAIDDLKKRYS